MPKKRLKKAGTRKGRRKDGTLKPGFYLACNTGSKPRAKKKKKRKRPKKRGWFAA